jgi:putative two-component system response regulator
MRFPTDAALLPMVGRVAPQHSIMSKPLVLAVDDHAENLTLVGDLLAPHYSVRVANSGERALALALKQPQPDIILLDVMMPGMDGYEVMRRLRDNRLTSDIPVLFLTAMDTTEDETRGLELGAVDYLTKPLRPAILLARIRAHLELKVARDKLRRQNTDLEREIARRMQENLAVQEVGIHALARLAETRDPETGNHLLRTKEYVRLLGNLLKQLPKYAAVLDDRTISLVARSAPLHDIGKVGIPDHVLLKPGKLLPHEWAIMKTHAALGAEAIDRAEHDAHQPVDFLAYAKEIAHYHHERWDGSGYPDGLAGDAIPVAARLMALADVFDALICRRVYKEPMGFEQARAIMASERGKHFDPDMLDVFLDQFDRFQEIAQRYADSAESVEAKLASVSGGRVLEPERDNAA